MQVVLDGTQDHLRLGAAAVAGDQRVLQNGYGVGHQLARVDQVANEILAALKPGADDVHSLLAGIHRLLCAGAAVRHDRFQKLLDGILVQIAHGLGQFFVVDHCVSPFIS